VAFAKLGYRGPMDETEHATRRREAADRHELSALLHDDAAAYWDGQGDPELAELERRNAELERAGAELERDRASLFEGRADPPTGEPPG